MLVATITGAFEAAGADPAASGEVSPLAASEPSLVEEYCEAEAAVPSLPSRAGLAADSFSATANPSNVNTVTAQAIRNRRTKLSLYSTFRIQLKAVGLCAAHVLRSRHAIRKMAASFRAQVLP
jgi:hypothetical protein